MVIEDFEYVCVFCSIDRLAEFIVIDQHQLGLGRIDQIGFADDTDKLPVVVDYR